MSSANMVALRYVAEVTMGTTPGTPALQPVRFLNESLNFNIENTASNEIRSDRAESDLVQVAASSAGDIGFELTYGTFDDWLQAAFCASSWTAVSGNINRITNGTTLKSYTIQKHFTDLTTPEYHNFTGCVINTMQLNWEVGKIVEGSFGLSGWDVSTSTSQIAGATTPAANSNTPMNAVSNFQQFKVDGSTFTGNVSSLQLSVNNNIRPIRALGYMSARDMVLGNFEVTGNMNIYFKDGALYTKFKNGTTFAVSFVMADAQGNQYLFEIPRAKFETGQVVAGGKNTDVMFNTTFRALYQSTAGYVIRLTRDTVG